MIHLTRIAPLACSVLLSLTAAACSGSPAPSSNPPPFAAATPIEDTDVAVSANVMAALQSDALFRDTGIEAVVRKGDVRLIGRVLDVAQREQAEAIARGVSGVHSVHNELTVGSAT
jgi:hypothetical protein